MNVAFQALAQNAGSKLAAAELALFKAGQVLQALVVGQTSTGLTQLKIGDLLTAAQLPQPALPGTLLQLQVKAGGAAPQLVLVSSQAPTIAAAQPSPMVAQVPLPVQVANVVLPEAPAVVPTPVGQPLMPQPPLAPAPSPSPQVFAQAEPPQVPLPAPAQPIASQAQPAAVQAPQTPAQPSPQQPAIAMPPQVVMPGASQIESTATVVPSGEPSAPPSAVQSQAQPLLAPVQPMPAPPAQASAETTAPPASTAPAGPETLPEPRSATAPVQPAIAAQAVVAAEPQQSEAAAANPLLLAQAAPKALPTMADLPRVAPSPAQAAPPAGAQPQSLPATPEQAVAQMVPEAMAKQNSVAPLLRSLAALVAQPAPLPEPLLRAALQVLAQRMAVAADGRVPAAEIEKAVARSGLFLEAGLATQAPVQGDAKASLLNLKAVLEKLLGGVPPASPPAGREAPPLKGAPPRAMAMELPPLPDVPREAARVLHGQTDAAISRVKLGQLAALSDAPATQRPGAPEYRMELPLLIGHELVLAQVQIAPDGRRHETTRKRGWTMRFAMHFSQTGEVGAEVGLLGKSVNVALWAAEPETAEALNAALPELARALEGLGLDPGPVRIRSGVPEPVKIASGHFVDATT